MQDSHSCKSLCKFETDPHNAHRFSAGVIIIASFSKEILTLEFSDKFRRLRKLMGSTTRPNLSICLSIPFMKNSFSSKNYHYDNTLFV